MDIEDLATTVPVGRLHGHTAVEPPGTKKGGIQNLWAVGGANDQNRLRWLEAIHLGQDLIQGLLAFVGAAADPDAVPRSSDGVQFVYEDD